MTQNYKYYIFTINWGFLTRLLAKQVNKWYVNYEEFDTYHFIQDMGSWVEGVWVLKLTWMRQDMNLAFNHAKNMGGKE